MYGEGASKVVFGGGRAQSVVEQNTDAFGILISRE